MILRKGYSVCIVIYLDRTHLDIIELWICAERLARFGLPMYIMLQNQYSTFFVVHVYAYTRYQSFTFTVMLASIILTNEWRW
jgi:hypothetical protein